MLVLICNVAIMAQTSATLLKPMKVIERAGGLEIRWETQSVDSAGVIWSQTIDATNYDDISFTTYPVAYSYRPVKYVASDSVNASLEYWTCDLDPSVDANWKVADTLFTTATLKATATPLIAKSTHDLNNIKAAYAKFKYRNNGSGSKKHYVNAGVYFPYRD